MKETSLRDVIRKALGKRWTRELEDDLFWPISYFCNDACVKTKQQTLNTIQKDLGILPKE